MNRRWPLPLLALALLGPPLLADTPKPAGGETYEVPYRLTNVKHILVRAKINGKGPYNFILDTGAPALFVSTKAAKELGVKPNRSGFATFDRFEIEGGVVIAKARGVVEDPPQLLGMNGLGIAGFELHGMIGYDLIAPYRMEIDFTKDTMTWTKLDFKPQPLPSREGRGGMPADMSAMGAIMQFLGAFLGKKTTVLEPRGFFGLSVEQDNLGVVVKSVLPGGPADRAGLKAGDRVTELGGRTVRTSDDLLKYAGGVPPGGECAVTVKRGAGETTITIKAGEGL
jgi:hypothetical protein